MTTTVIHNGTVQVQDINPVSGVVEVKNKQQTIQVINVGAVTSNTEIAVVQNITGLNPSQIKSNYEQNDDTNAFTDVLKDKLDSLSGEVLTTMVLNQNTLNYTDEKGQLTAIDLSPYLDNRNLSKITSGQMSGNNLVLRRDDDTSISIDLTKFLDDTNLIASVAGRIGDVILTKNDVSLSNVDNVSDIDKPISTAIQTALNNKSNASHNHSYNQLTNKPNIPTKTSELTNDSKFLTEEIIHWNDIVVDGTYIQKINSTTHKYSKNGTHYYRKVQNVPYLDIIFSDLSLTNEIARRG